MTLCDLTSSRAELAAVCAAGRSWGGPPAVLDVLERVLASIDRDLAERVAANEAQAARVRARRAEKRACSRTEPLQDDRTLSLFSDLKDPERAETHAREPTLTIAEPLTDARRAVAARFGIDDAERCWAKFVGTKLGLPLAKVDAAWLTWCARERPSAPKLAAAPVSETRIRAGPVAAKPREPSEPLAPKWDSLRDALG